MSLEQESRKAKTLRKMVSKAYEDYLNLQKENNDLKSRLKNKETTLNKAKDALDDLRLIFINELKRFYRPFTNEDYLSGILPTKTYMEYGHSFHLTTRKDEWNHPVPHYSDCYISSIWLKDNKLCFVMQLYDNALIELTPEELFDNFVYGRSGIFGVEK